MASNNDWREKVAAMTAPDDLDMEKAFSDMASGFITNKLGDLMRDEHRVGFEIVKKNEDNTRMLGIFAFKVDQKLLFAVVFFLNGEIKGPLLYRCDTQNFVPATKDWANYLIDNIEQSAGEGIAKSKSRMGNDSRVMMTRLMERPKSASVKAAAIEEFGEDIEAGMLDRMLEETRPGILRKFLEEPGIGKQAADLLVAATEDSPKFVAALAEQYPDPANLMPASFEEKQAAVKDDNLEIIYGFTKEAAANADQYFKDGFFLFDNRYLKDTCKVYLCDTTDEMENVCDLGVYDILRKDGGFENGCTVLPVVVKNCPWHDPQGPEATSLIIVKDGKLYMHEKEVPMLGIRRANSVDGGSSITKGNMYIPYIKGQQSACEPIYVFDTRSVDGVTYASVKPISKGMLDSRSSIFVGDGLRDNDNNCFDITVNPDTKSRTRDNVYGGDAVFIHISDAKEDDSRYYRPAKLDTLATEGNQDAFIYDKFKLPTVEVKFNKSAAYPYTFRDCTSDIESVGLTRKESLVKLAAELRIAAPNAYEILDRVERDGNVKFRIEGLGLDKEASMLHIVGRPDWSESGVSDTGLPMEELVQRKVLGISGDVNYHEVPHVGDALDPTKPTGLPAMTIVTADPASLREIADTYSLPHVFEHGVVGTLADTFDASKLLDKYMASFEEALDAIGRALFLLYWKPEDFERNYGKDDMTNLEAQLESEYESFGALTLELLKKTGKQKQSEPEPGMLV